MIGKISLRSELLEKSLLAFIYNANNNIVYIYSNENVYALCLK